ncbi:hypothetical protein NIES4103_10800 [Nostoc sp. NIES-4103]|nr:hypothetical protein NIES4103_10800 [Nostoc sp. NIES-4103]
MRRSLQCLSFVTVTLLFSQNIPLQLILPPLGMEKVLAQTKSTFQQVKEGFDILDLT